MEYDPKACHVQKPKPKEQCQHREGARHLLDNNRRVCGVHLRMHEKDKELVFMQDPGVQLDLVTGIKEGPVMTIPHLPAGPARVHTYVGRAAIPEARGRLARAWGAESPSCDECGGISGAHRVSCSKVFKEDNMSKKLSIAGSGSSSIMGDKEVMKDVFTWLVDRLTAGIDKGYTIDGISGAAPGFDYVWARAILEVDLPLTIALPSPDYLDYYWGLMSDGTHSLRRINKPGNRKWIDRVIEEATTVVHICDSYIVDGRAGKANFVRNEWMVDNCNWLWVYNPKSSGTSHAYSYAAKVQRKTLLVPVIKSK